MIILILMIRCNIYFAILIYKKKKTTIFFSIKTTQNYSNLIEIKYFSNRGLNYATLFDVD